MRTNEYSRAIDQPKPNVVLAVIDTLRADHVGAVNPGYQPKWNQGGSLTPNIDYFAKHCTVQKKCMSAASWTMVANASIMTGMYPWNHGLTDHTKTMDPKIPLISQQLKDAGYSTHAIVENKNFQEKFGYTRGFDTFHAEYMHTVQSDSKHIIGHDPQKHSTFKDHFHVFELAEQFLENPPEQYFLWFHTNMVHDFYFQEPYYEVPGYKGPFKNGIPQDDIKFRPFWKDLSPGEISDIIERYDYSISTTDQQIGKMLDMIDLENTVVIIAGDHGEGFQPEKGQIYHCGRLNQDILHVPLMFHFPDGLNLPYPEQVCSTTDIVPTLLEYLNIKPQIDVNKLGGRSLTGERDDHVMAYEKGYLYFWHLDHLRPVGWFTEDQIEQERRRISYRSATPFSIIAEIKDGVKVIGTSVRDRHIMEWFELDDQFQETEGYMHIGR
ncbi:sulfatase [Candidatus Woesearchaeota archaeon]|nr:sulfatase [Candidatus Woesearchaeota archaeon]